MNLDNFITSQLGLVHFVASMLAVVLGTSVLAMTKGTPRHRLLGKLYTLSMLVVLTTAFMIYRLFGTWGIFHWTALISSFTLLAGLLPIYLKRPAGNYMSLHFSFMYWSVMGVYAALVAETMVRLPSVVIESGIPNSVFYQMSGIGTAVVMGLAVFFFLRMHPKWDAKFGRRTA